MARWLLNSTNVTDGWPTDSYKLRNVEYSYFILHFYIFRRGGVIKMKKLMRFLKDEDGVTAIEYGLIAALIAVVIIVAVSAVGLSLDRIFTTISEKLDSAAGGS